MNWAETIGQVLAIFLTLCILSFLYRDNPFYKFAEHLFLGVSAGYFLVMQWKSTIQPNLLDPLSGGDPRQPVWSFDWWLLFVPLLLVLFMFTSLSRRYSWQAALPIAFIVGTYAGFNVIGFATGDLIIQLEANMLPVVVRETSGDFSIIASINNLLIILGLICCLFFFFFSRPRTGTLGVVAKVGAWFLMISFGASFGYAVMARISLAIGRAQELLDYSIISLVCALLITGGLLIFRARTRGPETPR